MDVGGLASAHVQNLATRQGCEELVAGALAEHGRIDALIHNAGIVRYHGIGDTPVDEYDTIMAINTDAAWWLCRGVVTQPAPAQSRPASERAARPGAPG